MDSLENRVVNRDRLVAVFVALLSALAAWSGNDALRGGKVAEVRAESESQAATAARTAAEKAAYVRETWGVLMDRGLAEFHPRTGELVLLPDEEIVRRLSAKLNPPQQISDPTGGSLWVDPTTGAALPAPPPAAKRPTPSKR